MKTYTAAELAKALRGHVEWLKGDPGGGRADLTWADLTEAYLTEADLTWAVWPRGKTPPEGWIVVEAKRGHAVLQAQ